MLIRLDNSRLVINAQEFPQNVVLMCLQYQEAKGEVNVTYFDGGRGQQSQYIEPTRRLTILPDQMFVHEFVMPFKDLHDALGRRGATAGFHFVADSAFRQGIEYGVRTLDFTMIFPVIGGGTIRFSIGGQEWELANPTFNPLADIPEINQNYGNEGAENDYVSGPPGIDNRRVPDAVVINAYRRTHAGYAGSRADDIERRRQQRVANFDLREVRPTDPEPEEEPVRMYSGPSTDATPPARIPVPPGVIIESNDPVEQRRQARLAQARAAEEQNLIQEQNQSAIVIGPTRAPKKPPRTRFEREED